VAPGIWCARQAPGTREEAMAYYRLYFLDDRTGRIERHEQFEANDDDAALDAIGPHIGDQPLELWTGGRKVGQFESALAVYAMDCPSRWDVRARSSPPVRRIFSF
jgi:hypothetical protein